jgi:hypothetical protein
MHEHIHENTFAHQDITKIEMEKTRQSGESSTCHSVLKTFARYFECCKFPLTKKFHAIKFAHIM